MPFGETAAPGDGLPSPKPSLLVRSSTCGCRRQNQVTAKTDRALLQIGDVIQMRPDESR